MGLREGERDPIDDEEGWGLKQGPEGERESGREGYRKGEKDMVSQVRG